MHAGHHARPCISGGARDTVTTEKEVTKKPKRKKKGDESRVQSLKRTRNRANQKTVRTASVHGRAAGVFSKRACEKLVIWENAASPPRKTNKKNRHHPCIILQPGNPYHTIETCRTSARARGEKSVARAHQTKVWQSPILPHFPPRRRKKKEKRTKLDTDKRAPNQTQERQNSKTVKDMNKQNTSKSDGLFFLLSGNESASDVRGRCSARRTGDVSCTVTESDIDCTNADKQTQIHTCR